MKRDGSIQSEWIWDPDQRRQVLRRVTIAGRSIPLERVSVDDEGRLVVHDSELEDEPAGQKELEI